MKVKHRFLNVLLTLCMIFCMVFSMAPVTVSADDQIPVTVWTDYADSDFAGGTGTQADPYLIATAGQLAKLTDDVKKGNEYKGKFFKLTKDIDLSEHRWVPIGIYKWEQGGTTQNDSFLGFIDGNNKTITGLIVDERTDKNAAGFLGNIRNTDGDTVGAKDLTISNAKIYAAEDGLEELQAGILAGYAMANEGYQVVFENITVSGTVEIEGTDGNNNVGGMIGYGTRVKATDCKAENISVTGASNSGGFVGLDGGSYYENCEVSGKISGTWAQGGFVGYSFTATSDDPDTQSVYKKCAADVEINGSDWNLGGFAGYAEYGKFDNCVAFGDVTSNVSSWEPHVGGFFGASYCVAANKCHVAGKVTSPTSVYKSVGGFVGCYFSNGTFTDCSFDSEKNSGLTAAGVDETYWISNALSSGVEDVGTCTVNGKICADYYDGKHTYSDELKFDENGHWYPTTCGHDNEEGALKIQPHTFGDWTVTKEATEDATGLKERNCVCGYKETAGIDKLAHTVHVKDNGTRVEPTCENKGSITYKCTKCGKVMEVVELDALGHSYTGKVTTEPTAEKEGVRTYTCDRCGHSYTESIPKITETGKPYIKDETGKEGWDIIRDELDNIKDGNSLIVEMNGSSVVPGDVFDKIKGKDITIVLDMGDGITWSVNGKSVTGDRTGDIDFTVKADTKTIPVDIINNVTGERDSRQISLAYDGEFGFTAVLSINVDAKNAGLYANLFYYNEKAGKMEFICADRVSEDGTAELTFTHASDYAIVIDKNPMDGSIGTDKTVDVPKTGDSTPAVWLYILVVLSGTGLVLAGKKMKEQHE